MDNFYEIYLTLIYEAQFDSDKMKRYDTFKGIEIYFNVDHVILRLKERYSYSFGMIRRYVKTFVKQILIDEKFIKFKGDDFPFTAHFTLADLWISGRLKKNFNKWRVEITTLLPNKDQITGKKITPKFSQNDYRKDINL